jgi:hypothetical protein
VNCENTRGSMKTIEALLRDNNAQLVINVASGKHLFMARIRFGSRYSAATAYGDSIDLAISHLEDALLIEEEAKNKKVKK